MSGAPNHDAATGQLVGDRLCLGCGYNLVGQPIVRETTYDMLVVRCPECATLASLQEYPLLGPWARRLGMAMACAWLVAILGLLALSCLAVHTMADTAADRGTLGYAKFLAGKQHAFYMTLDADDTTGMSRTPQNIQWIMNQPIEAWMPCDPTWLADQDRAALLAEAGGWAGALDWRALRACFESWPMIAPLGVLWAVMLAHWRRRRLLVLALFIPVLSMALVPLMPESAAWSMPMAWISMSEVAREQIGDRMAYVAMLLAIPPLAFALCFGRAIMRGLVRLLLPPRKRGWLAQLWTADGLDPPKPWESASQRTATRIPRVTDRG
jgi:hypothetical protein